MSPRCTRIIETRQAGSKDTARQVFVMKSGLIVGIVRHRTRGDLSVPDIEAVVCLHLLKSSPRGLATVPG